jgi:chloride channel protein, CIC family
VRNLLNRYRRHLTNYESVLAYSILGIVGGMASGLIVIAFELAIRELSACWELAGSWGLAGSWDMGEGREGFENLPRWAAFALPAAGATILGLVYSLLKPDDRETGIVHVISRMHSHYGALPLRNAVLQFVAGAFALATGQSGGREGPGVHLGGAINSLMGQQLGLPNNSLRVLIACGTAGGIAAAFHTPLAGVIFAMEVIIAEYTVVGFIPVMLAAVAASAVARPLATGGALLSIPTVELNSLWEIPYILLLGLICGVAAAGFIRLIKLAAAFTHWPVAARFILAGTFTGLLALAVPQILGMGNDTMNLIVQGEVALNMLLLIAVCKLLATAISCGFGMPIGIIGPSLLIGASIGSILGLLGNLLQPELTSDLTLYVVIGMAAAMAAMLNAPLAAILCVIELTHTVSIGMPALLAIVAANLTNNGIFHQRSAHQALLRQLRRATPDDPLNQLLHRTDVSSTMDVRVVRVPVLLQPQDLEPLLEFTPTWCLVCRGDQDLYLVQGSELLEWLAENAPTEEAADLTEAQIRRWTIATVPVQATLRQAMDIIRQRTVEAVCVCERSRATGKQILHGVITREGIEKFSLARL